MKCDYEEGERLAKTHICGFEGCTRELVVAHQQDGYHVYCNVHPLNDKFQPIRGIETQRPELAQHVEEHQKAVAQRRAEAVKTGALTVEHKGTVLVDVKDAGTKVLATADQVKALIEFADRYNLDVYRNHVCLMYGKPYVEIDGLYWLARQTKEFDGLKTRPMFTEEKRQVGWRDADIAWYAEVHRKGCSQPFTGWECTPPEKLEERTKDGQGYRWPVLHDRPNRMTEKQAIRYALRAAFPDLPVWESEE